MENTSVGAHLQWPWWSWQSEQLQHTGQPVMPPLDHCHLQACQHHWCWSKRKSGVQCGSHCLAWAGGWYLIASAQPACLHVRKIPAQLYSRAGPAAGACNAHYCAGSCFGLTHAFQPAVAALLVLCDAGEEPEAAHEVDQHVHGKDQVRSIDCPPWQHTHEPAPQVPSK